MDRNWKTGKYAMKFESLNVSLNVLNDGFKFDDDYILFNCGMEGRIILKIVNRRTMKIEEVNC